MKHSLIYRFIRKLINGFIEFYNFSTTKKIIDIIIAKVKIVFSESLFYKALVKNDNIFAPQKNSFIIQTFEKIINWMVKVVNSFISKGLKGSIVFSLLYSFGKSLNKKKASFVMSVVLSAILMFDIYAIITGAFTFKKIIFTFAVVVLYILNSFADILTVFKESIIRKSIAKIFEFNFEE